MTDPLEGIPDTAPPAPVEGGGSLGEIWSNLFPWEDLNAKGMVERYLKLGPDILPVLAAMVAKGPAGPKMVASDKRGFFGAQLDANPQTIVSVMAPQFTAAITVEDPQFFRIGSLIEINDTVHPERHQPYTVTDVKGNVLSLWGALSFDIQVGAVVRLVPRVSLAGNPPPWMAPNQPGRTIPGAGPFTAVLIAPANGFQVYLFGGILTVTVAAAGAIVQLLDDSLTQEYLRMSCAQVGQWSFDMHGAPGGLDSGVSVKVTGAATVFMNLYWSLAMDGMQSTSG